MITDELSAPDDLDRAPAGAKFSWALSRIAQRSADLDHSPRFPSENFEDLRRIGVLQRSPSTYADEVGLIRAVAGADGSTARILDGHLNATERLYLNDTEALRGELRRISHEGLIAGVWGADPADGEGTPARLKQAGNQLVLDGWKVYCSGAGGVSKALIVAADDEGQKRLAYLDATDPSIEIDRSWYRGSGLRASESHRVRFHETPVVAILGGPGELARQPYFSRDAIRTAGTWAGLVDTIISETLKQLGGRSTDSTQDHLLGKARVAAATIDRWLDHTITLLGSTQDRNGGSAAITTALECRIAVSACARSVAELSAEICGSRALSGAGTLDRARRDLDLFLLQHRLSSKITLLGAELRAQKESEHA